jgi:hypothetical protein
VRFPKLGGKGGFFAVECLGIGVVSSKIGERGFLGSGGGVLNIGFCCDVGGSAGAFMFVRVDCILAIMEVILASSPCKVSKAAEDCAWWRSRRRLTTWTSRGTRW